MKYFLVLIFVVSGAVFAKPTQQEEKLLKEAGENTGIDLSFSKETNLDNVERKCLLGIKRLTMGLKKTPEIESMATEYCVEEWKSLQ